MTTEQETLRKVQESELEMHVCKICGEKMDSKFCMLHAKEKGHNEFKPLAHENNNQHLKGGSGK